MFGVNGWEIVLLALIAVFVLGPDKLPDYAAKLARGIRKLRVMAEGAKGQLKDQLGPEYEDINWRQYDPRQYDPRRIVREALLDPLDEAVAPVRDEVSSVRSAARLRRDGDAPEAAVDGTDTAAPLTEGVSGIGSVASTATAGAAGALAVHSGARTFDPELPVPYDAEAT